MPLQRHAEKVQADHVEENVKQVVLAMQVSKREEPPDLPLPDEVGAHFERPKNQSLTSPADHANDEEPDVGNCNPLHSLPWRRHSAKPGAKTIAAELRLVIVGVGPILPAHPFLRRCASQTISVMIVFASTIRPSIAIFIASTIGSRFTS